MYKFTGLWVGVALFTGCGKFAPVEGSWGVAMGTVVDDTCGITDEGGMEDADLTLALGEEAGTFTLTDEDVTLDCTHDGMVFNCTDSLEADGVTQVITLNGEFESESSLAATLIMEISAQGQSCRVEVEVTATGPAES